MNSTDIFIGQIINMRNELAIRVGKNRTFYKIINMKIEGNINMTDEYQLLLT